MSKLLDARFVFQILLYLGAILLLVGIGASIFGDATDQWGLAAAGILSVIGSLSCFAVAHIGRTLLQISASNSAILTKLSR